MSANVTLFALLDSCLEADRGPPGFRGTIAVGVLGADALEWWVAEFSDRIQRRRIGQLPENFDAAVILGEREAFRLLDGRSIADAPRTLQLFGDRSLLLRFLGRYLRRRNVLGLRLAGTGSPKERSS